MRITLSQQQPDIDAVREMLTSLVTDGRTAEAVEAAIAVMLQMRHMHTELLLRVAQMQRERSGRRSERIDPAQLSLRLQMCEDAEPQQALEEESLDDDPQDGEVIEEAERVRRRQRRRRPAKELPREVIRHDLPAAERRCTGCGEEMQHIGDDTSEILELMPAQFRVQVLANTKCGHSGTPETRPLQVAQDAASSAD